MAESTFLVSCKYQDGTIETVSVTGYEKALEAKGLRSIIGECWIDIVPDENDCIVSSVIATVDSWRYYGREALKCHIRGDYEEEAKYESQRWEAYERLKSFV
jgi:hypothetical protein